MPRPYPWPKLPPFEAFPVAPLRIDDIAERPHFVLCKRAGLLLYGSRAPPWFAVFLGSSVVEHSTVNRMAAGSNPARGAIQVRQFSQLRRIRKPGLPPTVPVDIGAGLCAPP
jgi:hypothetical protein